MKRYSALAFVVSILIVTGCQKTEPIRESSGETLSEEAMGSRGNDRNLKCDFEEALSKSISDESNIEVPLFKKYYLNNSHRLGKIIAHFRNVTGGGYMPQTFLVAYQGRRQIFIDESNNDTAAILRFNNAGRLVEAHTSIPFNGGWVNRTAFRFIYTGNKLRRIESSEIVVTAEPPYFNMLWHPYIKLQYDHTNRNVSRIEFPAFGSQTGVSIVYGYDYTRRAKAQIYPDDMVGDYHYFFFFLKYLNVFPELMPENILLRSFSAIEYPGNFNRRYSHHNFDHAGKLVSYKQNHEFWKISWDCLSRAESH